MSYHTFKSLSRTLNIDLKYPKDKTIRILTTNFLYPLRKIFRLFTLVKDLAVRLLCLHDKTINYGGKKVFWEVQLVYILLYDFFPFDVFDI